MEDMQTILLYASNKEDALKSVTVICDAIKADERAEHQLYFTPRMMGAYIIGKGEVIDGVKKFVTSRELIIFPANRSEDLERLKKNKNIVLLKNCMSVVGDGYKSQNLLTCIISWLLGDYVEFNS